MKLVRNTVSVLALSLSLFVASNFVSQPKAQPPPESYPFKLLIDLRLPSDGRDYELVRHYFSGNARLRKDSFTIWNEKFDSVMEFRSYRKDERTACSEKRFPPANFDLENAFKKYPDHICGQVRNAPDQQDLGLLRRLALYDLDGQSFIKHEVRRKDGTLERAGERQRDGRYHIQYYYADGVTVHRDRYFIRQNRVIKLDPFNTDPAFSAYYQKKQFKLSFERVFRNDGSTPESQVVLVDGGYAKSLFNEKGERIATVNQDDGVYKNGDVYSADGKTLLASYTYSPWISEERYFRADGSLEEVRVMYMGTTEARIFDPNGQRVLYKQVWRDRPHSASGAPRSILSRVHIYDDASGKEILIRMVNDGTAVDEVSYSGSKPDSSLLSLANSMDQTRFKKSQKVKIDTYEFHDPSSPAWIYDYEDTENPVMALPTAGIISD